MPSQSHFPLAPQVRIARAGLSWSQSDLARHAGVCLRTIRNVEADRLRPRDTTIAKMISALSMGGADLEGEGRVLIRNATRARGYAVDVLISGGPPEDTAETMPAETLGESGFAINKEAR